MAEMDILSEVFTREDRRPVVATPPTGADGMLASIRSWFEVGHGDPEFIAGIVELRGERLALMDAAVRYRDGHRVDLLLAVQVDPGPERLERVMQFDPEQRDEAVQELDRLHEELQNRRDPRNR